MGAQGAWICDHNTLCCHSLVRMMHASHLIHALLAFALVVGVSLSARPSKEVEPQLEVSVNGEQTVWYHCNRKAAMCDDQKVMATLYYTFVVCQNHCYGKSGNGPTKAGCDSQVEEWLKKATGKDKECLCQFFDTRCNTCDIKYFPHRAMHFNKPATGNSDIKVSDCVGYNGNCNHDDRVQNQTGKKENCDPDGNYKYK